MTASDTVLRRLAWTSASFIAQRYDAVQTLEDFAVRLRHRVDLDDVGGDLRSVVLANVQPAHVSLWVRP